MTCHEADEKTNKASRFAVSSSSISLSSGTTTQRSRIICAANNSWPLTEGQTHDGGLSVAPMNPVLQRLDDDTFSSRRHFCRPPSSSSKKPKQYYEIQIVLGRGQLFMRRMREPSKLDNTLGRVGRYVCNHLVVLTTSVVDKNENTTSVTPPSNLYRTIHKKRLTNTVF